MAKLKLAMHRSSNRRPQARRSPPKTRVLEEAAAQGTTRLEVLTLLASLAVLAFLTLPLAARQQTTSARSQQLVCLANLRHIGRAYQLWATEHNDQNPYLVGPGEGGLRGVSAANNVWLQFAAISNELATPKVLVCPADTNVVRMARDFSSSSDGGFLNPVYRNSAVSYFVALHALRENPQVVLAGDRNLQEFIRAGSCSYAELSAVLSLDVSVGSRAAGWSASIHGFQGNILFNDRRTEVTSSFEMWKALTVQGAEQGTFHFVSH